MTLSPAQLDELSELLAAADTRRPWVAYESDWDMCISHEDYVNDVLRSGNLAVSDAALIAAAVNALPDLIATVRRLQSELAAKQAVIDKVGELADEYARLGQRYESLYHRTPSKDIISASMYSKGANMAADAAHAIRITLAGQEQT